MITKIFFIVFLGSVLTQVNPLLSRENRDTIDIPPKLYSGTVEKLEQQTDNKVNVIEQQESFMNKNVDVLKRILIEKTNIEKRAVRQQLILDTLKLAIGQQEITTKRGKVESQMEILLEKRPSNSSTRRKRSQQSHWSLNDTEVTFSIPEGIPDPCTPQEYYITHEIPQLKLNSLKKEKADLLLEEKKLENERFYLDLEQQRILDENASKFNSNPVLNERYLLLALLGRGRYGEVYKAFDLKEQRYVACKVHQTNNYSSEMDSIYINHTLQEYNIQRALNHPRIVKLYDAFEIDANTFCTVLEYCDGRDLEYYLLRRGTIPENEAKLIVMQIVSALKYLNEITPPVIHFDLKPDNILLMEESISGEIKIADFGESIIVDEKNPDQPHLSPDVSGNSRNPHSNISSTVDVQSVGFIFYRCLYGTWPVMEEEDGEGVAELKEVDFPNTPTVSDEAKNFIRSCLRPKREERINVLTLAQHQYLQPSVPEHVC